MRRPRPASRARATLGGLLAAVALVLLPAAAPALAAAQHDAHRAAAALPAATPRPTPAPVPSRTPATPAPSPSSPTRTDEGLELRLDDVVPAVAVPGQPVTVSVTITNTSTTALAGLDVRATLQSATPISRSALHAWPAGASLSRTADAGGTTVEVRLAPGDAAAVSLEIPGEALGPVDAATWGPRGLAVAATGLVADPAGAVAPAAPAATPTPTATDTASAAISPTEPPVGSLRTWLVLDAPESVAPVPYTVVIPVVPTAAHLAGAVGLVAAEDGAAPPGLSPALLPDAAALLAALDAPGVTAVVDPVLLEPDVDESGAPIVDAGGRPTSAALDAARALTEPDRELVLLPLADPDLAALAHASRDQTLTEAVEASARAAADLALPTRTDVALPVGSVVDQQTLALARRAGASAAVVPGAAAPPARTVGWTPATRADLPTGAEPLPALVGDSGLAQVVAGLLPAAPTEAPTGTLGALEARQLALAETAVIQRERPNHERPLTIYLERGQVPDAHRLATVLPALAEARWLAPRPLSAALRAEPQQPARVTPPEKEPARAEISGADLDRVARQLVQARDITTADPAGIVGPAEESARLLAAAGWRTDPAARDAAVARLSTELAELPRQVRIAPSSTINLLATSSELPVRVTNALPVAVDAVVTLDPPDARLSAPTSVQVTVPAHGEASARVPVEAAGSGNLEVRVLLATATGTRLGTPETIDIRVRADWETRGTAVAGIILTILVVAGIVRTARRRRRRADG